MSIRVSRVELTAHHNQLLWFSSNGQPVEISQLTSGRAYGARSMGRLEMRGPADAISHVCEMRCGCWYSRFLAALGMTIAEIP
jgi:hypothetical protein